MKSPALRESEERYADGTPKSIPGVKFSCDYCHGDEQLYGIDEENEKLIGVRESDEHICRECLFFYRSLWSQLSYKAAESNVFVPDDERREG
jgi:hypothetical protein